MALAKTKKINIQKLNLIQQSNVITTHMHVIDVKTLEKKMGKPLNVFKKRKIKKNVLKRGKTFIIAQCRPLK